MAPLHICLGPLPTTPLHPVPKNGTHSTLDAQIADRNRCDLKSQSASEATKIASSGPEKGVITKGVFSLEKSLESPKSLNSLESLENGRNLLSFPQSENSLETLESLNSLEQSSQRHG